MHLRPKTFIFLSWIKENKRLHLGAFGCEGVERVKISVTRFAKISPLWHDFKNLGQIIEGLFSIWQKFNLTLAKMLC